MPTWTDTQARARLAISALGLAPWAGADHAADLALALGAVPISPLMAMVVRSSRGERWAVTRYAEDVYQVAHADGRHRRGSAAEVVQFMEGNDAP